MQKTFPINNPVLKYLSSLDPKCLGVAASAMKKLSHFFPSSIKEDEIDLYHGEVDQFHLAEDVLPVFKLTDEKTPGRIDKWWTNVLASHNFPHLGCVVKAALSIFTGPRVEQSFSGMNNIIDSTSNRILVDTFSAIQTVRFDLLASKQKSVSKYHRKNYLLSPIRPRLCIKMKSSFDAHNKKLMAKQKRKADGQKEMGFAPLIKKRNLCTNGLKN